MASTMPAVTQQERWGAVDLEGYARKIDQYRSLRPGGNIPGKIPGQRPSIIEQILTSNDPKYRTEPSYQNLRKNTQQLVETAALPSDPTEWEFKVRRLDTIVDSFVQSIPEEGRTNAQKFMSAMRDELKECVAQHHAAPRQYFEKQAPVDPREEKQLRKAYEKRCKGQQKQKNQQEHTMAGIPFYKSLRTYVIAGAIAVTALGGFGIYKGAQYLHHRPHTNQQTVEVPAQPTVPPAPVIAPAPARDPFPALAVPDTLDAVLRQDLNTLTPMLKAAYEQRLVEKTDVDRFAAAMQYLTDAAGRGNDGYSIDDRKVIREDRSQRLADLDATLIAVSTVENDANADPMLRTWVKSRPADVRKHAEAYLDRITAEPISVPEEVVPATPKAPEAPTFIAMPQPPTTYSTAPGIGFSYRLLDVNGKDLATGSVAQSNEQQSLELRLQNAAAISVQAKEIDGMTGAKKYRVHVAAYDANGAKLAEAGGKKGEQSVTFQLPPGTAQVFATSYGGKDLREHSHSFWRNDSKAKDAEKYRGKKFEQQLTNPGANYDAVRGAALNDPELTLAHFVSDAPMQASQVMDGSAQGDAVMVAPGSLFSNGGAVQIAVDHGMFDRHNKKDYVPAAQMTPQLRQSLKPKIQKQIGRQLETAGMSVDSVLNNMLPTVQLEDGDFLSVQAPQGHRAELRPIYYEANFDAEGNIQFDTDGFTAHLAKGQPMSFHRENFFVRPFSHHFDMVTKPKQFTHGHVITNINATNYQNQGKHKKGMVKVELATHRQLPFGLSDSYVLESFAPGSPIPESQTFVQVSNHKPTITDRVLHWASLVGGVLYVIDMDSNGNVTMNPMPGTGTG